MALLIFGVVIGVNASRFAQPDQTMTPPGSPLPAPGGDTAGMSPVGPPTMRLEPGKPIPPAILAGMLQAARQSLFDGNYSQAIAAYQAVLKRDAKNVDALTCTAPGFLDTSGASAAANPVSVPFPPCVPVP